MKIFLAAFLVVLLVSVHHSQDKTGNSFEKRIKYIKPSEIEPSANCPKMPLHIVEYLEKSGCLIPQSDYIKNTHGGFQIPFGNKEQNDWAVLCSKNGFSSIWIFWNGSTSRISQFANYPDTAFINSGGYFRVIGKDTTKPQTKENLRLYGEIIPQINTWGIDELTPDREHVIYYIYQNQLVILESDLNLPSIH